jgi:hypothetical protein
MSDEELLLHRTLATLSQSDPLIKLLEQVRLGRMQPADPGLRAITESWLATYRKAIESAGWKKQALRRLDPTPRLAVLVEQKILPADHAEASRLVEAFQEAMARASV